MKKTHSLISAFVSVALAFAVAGCQINSGNFDNGLSSSDLSRANWCPGTITQPNYIILGDLPKGKHTITIKIPQGEPVGV